MSKLDDERFNPKEYEYVGPKEIYNQINEKYKGTRIKTLDDILSWMIVNYGKPKINDIVICTFVIDLKGKLLIADRHSEHVQCANGEKVKSAGEIGFLVDNKKMISVSSVTNQSTGYCPSSASWFEVEIALKKIIGLDIPEKFETEFIFSYCQNCKTRQIVKDEYFFCPKCDQELLSENEFQKRRMNLEFK